MSRTVLSLVAILICIVLFFGINIAGTSLLRGARADLTEGRLYTLSEGSRAVARKVQEPIKLTLYLSDNLDSQPDLKAYAARVKDFLREYANASGGKIKLQVINPEPFSEAEEAASAAGITGRPDFQTGGKVYFGLLAENSTDKSERIPMFDLGREAFLEYDLTRIIYLLSNPQKNTIGIMAWLPINGTPNNPMMRGQNVPPWQVAAQLGELFDVKSVATDAAEIPPEVKVLLVVHPKNISDKTQYAIDQFALKGGRVMVFVDPWCESDVPPGINPNDMNAMKLPKASSLPRLLAAWGVEVLPERWAADRDAAIRLRSQANPEQMIDHLQYLELTKRGKNLDESDSATGDLQMVRVGIPGVIVKKPDATTDVHTLLTTGPRSQTMDVKIVQFFPQPNELLTQFKAGEKPGDNPLTIAARITGKAKTAFPEGDPAKPSPAAGQPAPADTSLKEGDITVVVVADCDMLTDRFWISEQRMGNILLGYAKNADNGDFVIGTADNLCGSSDLMSLRARGKFSRPFERVEKIQKEAEDKFLAKAQDLQNEKNKTQTRIDQLRTQAPQGGGLVLTPEMQSELENLLKKRRQFDKDLRKVNLDLRRDIDSLGTKLKVINIGLMPLAVGVLAVGLSLYRVNRRRSVKAAGRS